MNQKLIDTKFFTYGNEEVFHPYEGFEADVGF